MSKMRSPIVREELLTRLRELGVVRIVSLGI